MYSDGCILYKKKRKEIVRYLGILGISSYSCEVHGNVLGIVEVCFRLHRFWKKLGICELFFCLPYKKCNQTKTMSQTFHELFKNYEFKTKTCSPFETLVDNFCSVYNKMDGCEFEITPEMIHQWEDGFYRFTHDKSILSTGVKPELVHSINMFVANYVRGIRKGGVSHTWVTIDERPTITGRYTVSLNDGRLEMMRRHGKYHRVNMRVFCKDNNIPLGFRNPLDKLSTSFAKQTMFGMCKAMANLTPKTHAHAMLLCLKRGAPKLYAVNDVVSQFEDYLKLGDFTEQDFIDIMKSDQGALVLRLYCAWWVLTMNHVLANPETLTQVSSSGKRKPVDTTNVFVHRKAKRRRFY